MVVRMTAPPHRPVISKELLRELGDWRTEKEGRTLAAAGAVVEWEYQEPFLAGTVRGPGGTLVKARLKLGAKAVEVQNLCACRQARVEGTICAHVMALVFATMQPSRPPPVVATPPVPTLPELKRVPLGGEHPTLELMILLPLNLAEAWRSGSMRIIFEGSVNGAAFQPFDMISQAPTYAVSEADERVFATGPRPGVWLLPAAEYDDFFAALAGHPRVWLGKRTPITVRGTTTRPQLMLDLEEDGALRLRLTTETPGGESLGGWTFDGRTLTRTNPLPAGYQPGEHRLSRAEFVRFYQRELPALQQLATIQFGANFDRLEFVEQPARVALMLDGGLTGLNLTVQQPAETEWTPDPEQPFRYLRTQVFREAEIEAAGFERQGTGYRLASENRVGHFLANVLPGWEQKWQVTFGAQFANFLRKCDRIQPAVTVQSSGTNWLAVDLSYPNATGTPALTPAEVQRMLQKGAAHQRQANGRIALVPSDAVEQFQQVIFDCDTQPGGQVDRKFAPYLAEALRASPLRTAWQAPAEVRAAPPLELPACLRPYQREGVNWLHQLATNQLAGILADEMGLGKTIQTLVWLATTRCTPALVVCPTSLLANWQSEAARFAPGLKTLVLHGAEREFAAVAGQDLVITSYALLRRDIAEHQTMEWQAVVLDEAQHIKNRFSQIAQAVKALRAKHRLVLTGTPLENSLGDLWSIFDFLMPGYLGPAAEFRERYEQQPNPASMTRLRQRVRPFVLRRTKAEVARELPEKIEQVTWCDLTGEQQAVYQEILAQGRREVFAGEKESQRRMAVLTTLLRLRQAACHLGLLPTEREWREPSAKLATCLELIEEAVSGNHRVLVFSQFVKLLKLVQAALPVPHCYLDGSTVDRAGEIRRFQESDVPVFLISLKAGGTGLNLTGADTVIHLDPWWNPAAEEQATARAHRIGQRSVVTSYKLIARGSVEEKIVRLQEKKKDLIAQTLTSDEAFAQQLTLAELQELLA